MGRITVNVDEALLRDAMAELGTKSKVATINGALRNLADQRKARKAIEVLNSISLDTTGSSESSRFDRGRDLSRLEADALVRKGWMHRKRDGHIDLAK